MSNAPKTPDGYPISVPEVAPQLIPMPEIEKEKTVPIEVVNGALDELRRKERDEERGRSDAHKPTVH
ncbi:MAG: hypothetical protein Q7S52_04085 [bacterium]|nr:hypothetical protein [bacterium]